MGVIRVPDKMKGEPPRGAPGPGGDEGPFVERWEVPIRKGWNSEISISYDDFRTDSRYMPANQPESVSIFVDAYPTSRFMFPSVNWTDGDGAAESSRAHGEAGLITRIMKNVPGGSQETHVVLVWDPRQASLGRSSALYSMGRLTKPVKDRKVVDMGAEPEEKDLRQGVVDCMTELGMQVPPGLSVKVVTGTNEADDVIVRGALAAGEKGHSVIVVSTDTDLATPHAVGALVKTRGDSIIVTVPPPPNTHMAFRCVYQLLLLLGGSDIVRCVLPPGWGVKPLRGILDICLNPLVLEQLEKGDLLPIGHVDAKNILSLSAVARAAGVGLPGGASLPQEQAQVLARLMRGAEDDPLFFHK